MARKRVAVKRPDGGIVMRLADKVERRPVETASVKPAEKAVKTKPKARKKGSGKK